jgi:hypothetical protein
MKAVTLIHRKTSKRVSGLQYKRGMHPPPPGVRVTLGLAGPLARCNTAQGEDSVIFDGDWLVTMPNGDKEIYTDTFIRDQYRRVDEEPGEAKPVRL